MDGGFAIETSRLAKRFGEVHAVAGIDLRVPMGSVFGFLGPNGAGKTTTIRMLVGLIAPTSGSVRLLGTDVAPGRVDLRGVGAVVERPAFYPYLSAAGNLRLFATLEGLHGRGFDRAISEALERTGLGSAADRKVAGFSTGMRQRLGLALAMLHAPRLVILDEPTNGLDPAGVVEVRATIKDLASGGTTVFLSSHVLTEVEQLCDEVAVLAHGRIVATGAPADLRTGPGSLRVRFDTAPETAAARALLADGGIQAAADDADALVLRVALPASDGSAVARRLASSGLFPAELTPIRPTLEAAFLELTREGDWEAESPAEGSVEAGTGAP